jgi:hypothetical protein
MTISRYVRFRGGPTPPSSPDENPNPGIEVREHLVAELPALGVTVLGTEDIEFAHEIRCEVEGQRYAVTVGYDWVTGGWWEIFYAPRLSWVKRLLGQREDAEMRALTRALAAALARLPGIAEVRWYEAYGARVDARHTTSPELQ